MAKFKIDENLPAAAAQILIDEGHDARTVREQDMGGADDLTLGQACQQEGRVIVTLDRGFA